MNSKLKSRKFWMAVVTGAILIANEGLDLNLDRETILAFTGLVLGYIFAEAAVDRSRPPEK